MIFDFDFDGTPAGARAIRVAEMMAPVECRWCLHVYDAGSVTVLGRYADCSTWRCPSCGTLVDDRPPRAGGGVYQLTQDGRRR